MYCTGSLKYAHMVSSWYMENASSISKPPICFAVRPVVAPKALFIGVLSACHGAGAPSLNLRHLLICIRWIVRSFLAVMNFDLSVRPQSQPANTAPPKLRSRTLQMRRVLKVLRVLAALRGGAHSVPYLPGLVPKQNQIM